MSTKAKLTELDYPTSDGKPMAETPLHRRIINDLIMVLQAWFLSNTRVYVSGNMMLYYAPGNRRKFVSPDVQVTLGIPKEPEREIYLTWKEGKGPDVVFEITSKSTRKEDLKTKFALYRDVLQVREYFLFDPREEYLRPSMQGFRLENGLYVRIEPVGERLASEVLQLHLERRGSELRLWNPASGIILPTPQEQADQFQAALEKQQAKLQQLEAEVARLRASKNDSH